MMTRATAGPLALEDLFQPLRRLGIQRTRPSQGHGLGLAIVRAVANAHGATLTARARPHGGLDLEVIFRRESLPAIAPPVPDSRRRRKAPGRETFGALTSVAPNTGMVEVSDTASRPLAGMTGRFERTMSCYRVFVMKTLLGSSW